MSIANSNKSDKDILIFNYRSGCDAYFAVSGNAGLLFGIFPAIGDLAFFYVCLISHPPKTIS